jgi:hypothetical protein
VRGVRTGRDVQLCVVSHAIHTTFSGLEQPAATSLMGMALVLVASTQLGDTTASI